MGSGWSQVKISCESQKEDILQRGRECSLAKHSSPVPDTGLILELLWPEDNKQETKKDVAMFFN